MVDDFRLDTILDGNEVRLDTVKFQRADTTSEKKLTNLTFYFKANQTPLGTFEPLKL